MSSLGQSSCRSDVPWWTQRTILCNFEKLFYRGGEIFHSKLTKVLVLVERLRLCWESLACRHSLGQTNLTKISVSFDNRWVQDGHKDGLLVLADEETYSNSRRNITFFKLSPRVLKSFDMRTHNELGDKTGCSQYRLFPNWVDSQPTAAFPFLSSFLPYGCESFDKSSSSVIFFSQSTLFCSVEMVRRNGG